MAVLPLARQCSIVTTVPVMAAQPFHLRQVDHCLAQVAAPRFDCFTKRPTAIIPKLKVTNYPKLLRQAS